MFSYGSGGINKQNHSWNSLANGRFQAKRTFWVVEFIVVAFRLCHRLCDMVR